MQRSVPEPLATEIFLQFHSLQAGGLAQASDLQRLTLSPLASEKYGNHWSMIVELLQTHDSNEELHAPSSAIFAVQAPLHRVEYDPSVLLVTNIDVTSITSHLQCNTSYLAGHSRRFADHSSYLLIPSSSDAPRMPPNLDGEVWR